MNKNDIIRQAKTEIASLEQLISKIEQHDSPPRIEIDIILSKIRSLYEVCTSLHDQPSKHHQSPAHQTEAPPVTPVTKPTMELKDTTPEKITDTTNSKNTTILSDKFKEQQGTLYDNIAKTHKKPDLISKLQTKPIANIEAAIGINEKFLFIRELFNNDAAAYSNALQTIESIATHEEASTYIAQFSWNTDSDAYKKLADIIERKYHRTV